jgi:hypothetical protein
VGCNSCACTIADSLAHFILVHASQVIACAIQFASSDFPHRDPIFYCRTPFCAFPHRHIACANTCTTRGLVFYTWLSSSKEPVEGLLFAVRFDNDNNMTSDSAISEPSSNHVELSSPAPGLSSLASTLAHADQPNNGNNDLLRLTHWHKDRILRRDRPPQLRQTHAELGPSHYEPHRSTRPLSPFHLVQLRDHHLLPSCYHRTGLHHHDHHWQ